MSRFQLILIIGLATALLAGLVVLATVRDDDPVVPAVDSKVPTADSDTQPVTDSTPSEPAITATDSPDSGQSGDEPDNREPAGDNQPDLGNLGTTTPTEPAPEPDSQPVAPENPVETTPSSGLYLDYTPAGFEQHQASQRWLYYHADWCPQCVKLDQDIRDNLAAIPAGVVILKLDYDNNRDLRARYRVNQQTTVVRVDDQGDLVKSYGAYRSPSLQALIDNLL